MPETKDKWKKYKNEKEPRSCSLPEIQEYRINREQFLESNIIPFVKKKGDVIYGGKSQNAQLPKEYQRKAEDYDIWSKKPKLHTDQLEDKLDSCAGCDLFTEEQMDVGDGKKLYRIKVNTTGKQEVDYTKLPPKKRIKTIKGIKYHDVRQQKERLLEMKKDPKLAFRLHKTERDLRLIEAAEKKEKKKTKLEKDGFIVMDPFW